VLVVVDSSDIAQDAPLVKSLFPEGVFAKQVYGAVSPRHLFQEEQTYVDTAVQKRKSEFAAGRVCARRALAMLGFIESPLLVAQERVPLWPTGALGSISHTDDYCVAVAGLTRNFSGIGVDTEILGRVEPELWPHVFRIEEIACLKQLSESRQIEMAAIMFSAKEAFYKCQFSVTRSWLGFEDVSVEAGEEDTFRILICDKEARSSSFQKPLCGRYAIQRTHVICGMAIET
jgi:4'-phosphopantetheinyl transferase EntD